MSPKHKTLPSSEPPLSKPSFKFLRRNLTISPTTIQSIKKVCIKRLYLKTFADNRTKEPLKPRTNLKPLRQNKLLKTLKYIKLSSSSFNHFYSYEALKGSKGLKTFDISAHHHLSRVSWVPMMLKSLFKWVQTVNVHVYQCNNVNNKHIYKIAKSLECLPELRYFSRYYSLKNAKKYLSKELDICDKAVSKLKNVERVVFVQSYEETKDLQRTLDLWKKYPHITGLKFLITNNFIEYFDRNPQPPRHSQSDSEFSSESSDDFPYESGDDYESHEDVENAENNGNVEKVSIPSQDNEQEEDSEMSEHDENEEIHEAEEVVEEEDFGHLRGNSMFPETVSNLKPFFRYELFPNLKKLDIVFKDHCIDMKDSVIKGFAHLENLKELNIDMARRFMGSGYIFHALLELSLLKRFSLKTADLSSRECETLWDFLEGQAELEVLELKINQELRSEHKYLDFIESLEGTIGCLKNKSHLRELCLESPFLPLTTLGAALKKLKGVDKLTCLKLEGYYGRFLPKEELKKGVEGICEFIKRQKGSLKKLEMGFPYVIDEKIVNSILSAISELEGLKELRILMHRSKIYTFNCFGSLVDHFWQIFALHPKTDVQLPHKWNPNVAKTLEKLRNLEKLHLEFDVSDQKGANSATWILDVLNILPSLEKLTTVHMTSETWKVLERFKKKFIAGFLGLEKIKELVLEDILMEKGFWLKDVAIRVNQRQALRSDLMF